MHTNTTSYYTIYTNRANHTRQINRHQMKINHCQNILSPSKLNSISSLPLSAKDILSAETNVAYASTALIIANATNLNELQTTDNIFSDKLPIYKHLLSPLNIDRTEPCEQMVAIEPKPTTTPQSQMKCDDINSEYIKNIRNSYRKEETEPPPPPTQSQPQPSTETTTHSIRSGGRGPPLSYQNRFLSLSISPPLTRRQEMPVLRGTFVSL